MKKISIIIFILMSQNIIAQKFNVRFLEKITEISQVSIDEFMIDGYSFKKIKEEDNGEKKIYARTYNNDFDSSIIISILFSKNWSNTIDISVTKNYDISEIKDNILSEGYEFVGSNEFGSILFKKENLFFSISKEKNKFGATQIILFKQL